MNQSHKNPAGFTVIELLLAMTGIAFLLLFVVFAIMHTLGLYSKGVSIRQINQAGRQVSDEIVRAIRYSSTQPVVRADINRLCVNGVAYIWNTMGATTNRYSTDAAGTTSLVFVSASGGTYCEGATPPMPTKTTSKPLLSSLAVVRELSVAQIGSTPLYDIKLVLSTAPSNEPSYDSAAGTYSCSAQFGQYCAFGEFTTSVYARKK